MKLPKELQEKKKKNSEQLTEKRAVWEMVKSFKLEFLSIKERFKDSRKIKFFRIGDVGKFSFLIPSSKDKKNPALCFWTEDIIEIYFGIGAISNFFTYINFNLMQYKKLFKELAQHEYGHILSIKTSYDIYSKRIANMIKSGLYSFNEIETQMDYSIEEEINQALTKVDIFKIGHVFREFLANYMVYKKITKNHPSMLFITNCVGIASHIKSLRRGFVNPNQQTYDKLFFLLECSSNHFIYNKWDTLTKNLKNCRIEKILDLLYKLNSTLQNIIDNYPEYENQIEKIFELVPLLDQVDYKNVVLDNNTDRSYIALLNTFR